MNTARPTGSSYGSIGYVHPTQIANWPNGPVKTFLSNIQTFRRGNNRSKTNSSLKPSA